MNELVLPWKKGVHVGFLSQLHCVLGRSFIINCEKGMNVGSGKGGARVRGLMPCVILGRLATWQVTGCNGGKITVQTEAPFVDHTGGRMLKCFEIGL